MNLKNELESIRLKELVELSESLSAFKLIDLANCFTLEIYKRFGLGKVIELKEEKNDESN